MDMSDPDPHDPVTLKSLLQCGTALLAPPAPLPSSPPMLLDRLTKSSALVPWKDKEGWGPDDELEQIGDDDPSFSGRKARRDQLVMLVGKRSLDLIVAMQSWLAKEFWPVELKDGLNERDFLLGTADLRLVRLLLSHALSSYVLPLTVAYVLGLARKQPADERFAAALSTLIGLIHTPVPPVAPSASVPLPPTSISQTIISSHLPLIIVATVALSWTPTVPPPIYASLRSDLLRSLDTLRPTQTLASLGTSLTLVQAGKTKPSRGWTMRWPGYVEATLGSLMSTQMQRRGGVEAVMENVFGEAANMNGPEAVDASKLEQVARLLSKVPRNSTPEAYLPKLLTSLFELIGPTTSNRPVIYTHAASYVVHSLWQSSAIAVEWLDHRLHSLWLPTNPQPGMIAPSEDIVTATETATQLVIHAPPSPDFTDFVIGPILQPLFALQVQLTPKLTSNFIQSRGKSSTSPLADGVNTLLSSWGKVVDSTKGVEGVWSVIVGDKGWSQPEGDALVLYWEPNDTGATLMYGMPPLPPSDPQIMVVDGEEESDLMNQIPLSPDPPSLARWLQQIQRPDISTAVFLKVLDEWRVRAKTDDEDPFKSLLFLRLTLAMMDTLGDKLLSNPEHVLAFVEGVLSDEAQGLRRSDTTSTNNSKRPLIEELNPEDPTVTDAQNDEPLPDLTAEGVEKLGMVETAISLLLASLEANEKLDFKSSAILHPIHDHLEALSDSPSSNVRRLAREALLILLVRRSASLTDSKGQVSPAIAVYRRALTLVSDELLPVRAHGLVLLRDLALSKDYDPALTPSILDVFMQNVLDKDSYIYLNAIQGLAAMVDALGSDIFRTLVRVYTEGTNFSDEKLDKSLRIGEALGMIIRRSGKALRANANIIVPPLLTVFPDENRPTILRASALSLLSKCAEVDHLTLLPWANELTTSSIDLVQVESVVSSPFRPTPAEPATTPKPRPKVMLVDDEEPEEEPTVENNEPHIVDDEPTQLDGKHPALRRAAVVFLGLLVASLIEAANEDDENAQRLDEADGIKIRIPTSSAITLSSSDRRPGQASYGLDPATLDRAVTILRYVAHTDEDEVVRGQANEVVALLERLKTVRMTQQIGSRLLL